MRFFVDRCIPCGLARMLDGYELEHEVRHHDDRFAPVTPDVEWIRELAADDPPPAVLTSDTRLRRNTAETAALREADLTVFILKKGWTNLTYHEQACHLLRVWPLIVRNSLEARSPTVFEVPVAGRKLNRLAATRELG